MPLVRYVGGSMNDTELMAPDVVANHPQREVTGPDRDRPFEMYVRTRETPDGAVIFEYTGSSATRVLDDDQNYVDQGAGQ